MSHSEKIWVRDYFTQMETEGEQMGVWRKLEQRHLFPNLSLGGGAYLRGGTYSRTYSKNVRSRCWEKETIIMYRQNLLAHAIVQGRCQLIPKYFCEVYDYAGKGDLTEGLLKSKRKIGVTTHFSKIIKQQLF